MSSNAPQLLRRFTKKFRRSDGPGPAMVAETGATDTGYDALTVKEVLAHLNELTPADLATLGAHERAHQNRVTVLADVDARLGNEPWPGYDGLDVPGVRFGLDGAGRDRLVTVLAYELAHKNRAGVVLAAQQRSA